MDKALQLRVIAALQDKLSGPLNKIKGSSAASAQGVADLRKMCIRDSRDGDLSSNGVVLHTHVHRTQGLGALTTEPTQ